MALWPLNKASIEAPQPNGGYAKCNVLHRPVESKAESGLSRQHSMLPMRKSLSWRRQAQPTRSGHITT
jgi:hypothetical protein